MKVLINFGIIGCLFISSICFAYTQCEREIKDIWSGLTATPSPSVWVTFTDGGSSVYKYDSQITTGQMSRFTSLVLTAQSANRKLLVRYPEDGLSCPPMGTPRNDIEGIWIRGQ